MILVQNINITMHKKPTRAEVFTLLCCNPYGDVLLSMVNFLNFLIIDVLAILVVELMSDLKTNVGWKIFRKFCNGCDGHLEFLQFSQFLP